MCDLERLVPHLKRIETEHFIIGNRDQDEYGVSFSVLRKVDGRTELLDDHPYDIDDAVGIVADEEGAILAQIGYEAAYGDEDSPPF